MLACCDFRSKRPPFKTTQKGNNGHMQAEISLFKSPCSHFFPTKTDYACAISTLDNYPRTERRYR